MLFILPGLYGLPLQLHNKVFKFDSMWRGNRRILFQVFSIHKITDMLSSNHHLSLHSKAYDNRNLKQTDAAAVNKQIEGVEGQLNSVGP